jgi:hypothetical protein
MEKGEGTGPDEAVPSGDAEKVDPSNEAEMARRQALKRLGILGAYTSPAMMVLLSSKIAAAQAVTSGTTG